MFTNKKVSCCDYDKDNSTFTNLISSFIPAEAINYSDESFN